MKGLIILPFAEVDIREIVEYYKNNASGQEIRFIKLSIHHLRK
jgi:hypothetical protein